MKYTITKQFARGQEIPFAEFKDLRDAENFIEQLKLPEDVSLNVKIIYRIFEGLDLVRVYDPIKEQTGSSGSQTSTGKSGSTASFSPTPFNTTPRPAGSPQKWIKEPEDKDKEDKS